MKCDPGWSSHLPLLTKIMAVSSGPVLEMGTGLFSTPILHWLCYDRGRELVSYENDPKYYQLASSFASQTHHLVWVDDWNKADIQKPWGVAFIDHKPEERRVVDIERLIGFAHFVVVHDTEPEGEVFYHYADVFKKFKYRFDYKKAKPWTTVLSNFDNL